MKDTKVAFAWIVSLLRKRKISFQISCALAAKVYGATRDLADIDIDLDSNGFAKIIDDVRQYATFGPAQYKDANWNLPVATLVYSGQEIDLLDAQRAWIFDKKTKKWVKYKWHPERSIKKNLFGKIVHIENKEDLIYNKNCLRRRVDIVDLKQIS